MYFIFTSGNNRTDSDTAWLHANTVPTILALLVSTCHTCQNYFVFSLDYTDIILSSNLLTF